MERNEGPGIVGRLRAAGCLLAVLLVALPSDARGQEPAEDEPGWRGNADLGFTLTQGNSETTNLSLGAKVIHQAPSRRWTFDGSYLRATTDGDETANKADASAQFDYFPQDRFFLFARAAAGFNRPAGIDRRLAPGLGVGYTVVAGERADLDVEAGARWIQDRFVDGSTDEAVYASLEETFSLVLNSTTDLAQSLAYAPKAEDFGEFLLEAEVKLTTEITDGLGLRVSVRDDYDSDPFVDPETGEQREKNDLTFVTGVTFSF